MSVGRERSEKPKRPGRRAPTPAQRRVAAAVAERALNAASGAAAFDAAMDDGRELTASDWLEDAFPLGVPKGFL